MKQTFRRAYHHCGKLRRNQLFEGGIEMDWQIDTNNDEEILLDLMVKTIVSEVAPETIILFGSRARGDARPDSDVDLLVVESEPFSPQRSRRKEAARLYMALRGLAVSKDILLYSREEFESRKNSLSHVVGRAHREGRVLHGRS
jgi:predicted nucleotidyltransferase